MALFLDLRTLVDRFFTDPLSGCGTALSSRPPRFARNSQLALETDIALPKELTGEQ